MTNETNHVNRPHVGPMPATIVVGYVLDEEAGTCICADCHREGEVVSEPIWDNCPDDLVCDRCLRDFPGDPDPEFDPQGPQYAHPYSSRPVNSRED